MERWLNKGWRDKSLGYEGGLKINPLDATRYRPSRLGYLS